MEEIEKIYDYVEDELADAEKYAKCAAKSKLVGDTDKLSIATKLSEAELEHASIWYDFMRNKAKAMRSMYESKSEPMPEYIEMRITDMTDYYMEKSAKVRYMLDSNRR